LLYLQATPLSITPPGQLHINVLIAELQAQDRDNPNSSQARKLWLITQNEQKNFVVAPQYLPPAYPQPSQNFGFPAQQVPHFGGDPSSLGQQSSFFQTPSTPQPPDAQPQQRIRGRFYPHIPSSDGAFNHTFLPEGRPWEHRIGIADQNNPRVARCEQDVSGLYSIPGILNQDGSITDSRSFEQQQWGPEVGLVPGDDALLNLANFSGSQKIPHQHQAQGRFQ
jgi:hypothetical protein